MRYQLPVTNVDWFRGESRLRVAKAGGSEGRTWGKLASGNRWLLSLLFLVLLPGVGRPQTSSSSQSGQHGPYTIKVDVDMVVLHATVQNHKGVLVSGLGKDHFQVYEGGVLQEIKYFSHEDTPVTVGLIIDNSGSMAPKRSDVIAAALAFARSSNPDDQIFVVNFNERVSFGLPAGTPFTDRAAQLEVALSRIGASGETALYDALAIGLEHLKQGNRDKKVLIVISDGGDNASVHNLAQIMTMAGQSDAIIYTLGLFDEDDPDRNPRALKQLAHATGGEAFLPASLSEVVPICEQIARDIRNQYTIAYVPTNRQLDGTYRIIQAKAGTPAGGSLTVRTRAGYYAPLSPPAAAAARSQP